MRFGINVRETRRVEVLLVIILVSFIIQGWADRFREYTNQQKNPPGLAKVLSAGYLGGEGSEWFSSVAFQKDGTLVIAGVSVRGPIRIQSKELGLLSHCKDLEKMPTQWERVEKKDGKGNVSYEEATWTHKEATGFILRLNLEKKTVISAIRFPWQSGAITALVTDEDDFVYGAGVAGKDSAFWKSSIFVELKEGSLLKEQENLGFLFRLTPDLSKVVWGKRFPVVGHSPDLRMRVADELIPETTLGLIANGLWIIDKGGKLIKQFSGPSNLPLAWAMDIQQGGYAIGGDRNTRTGREPWRQPWLYLYTPGQKQEVRLYEWDPKLVGHDDYRLVSDSSIRYLHYGEDRCLYIAGWSDGGNTVFEKSPVDLKQRVPYGKLNFTAWGVKGAISLAHLIKIDLKDYSVCKKILWCTFFPDKNFPNSARIRYLTTAKDGSVMFAGDSALGLIQTGNALHPEPDLPGGPYIAILDPEWNSLRFSSCMLACGFPEIRSQGKWHASSSEVNGRKLVAFVCGAIREQKSYCGPYPAPSLHPFQEKFGGGDYDGYLIVFEF